MCTLCEFGYISLIHIANYIPLGFSHPNPDGADYGTDCGNGVRDPRELFTHSIHDRLFVVSLIVRLKSVQGVYV